MAFLSFHRTLTDVLVEVVSLNKNLFLIGILFAALNVTVAPLKAS